MVWLKKINVWLSDSLNIRITQRDVIRRVKNSEIK
ncbi:hypothetical protein PUN28_012844 [Cardiocondyla obscurior]|uniref:Uncharacterized protein n=1 Tax=Cardiocondyla obscurior TaxID=286306 RepID=A0AAW2F599_9HYME